MKTQILDTTLKVANFALKCFSFLSCFLKQVYICSERVAQVLCILMLGKYVPTHAS